MEDIQKAVKDFLAHCKEEKNLNDKTLKAYKIDLQQFVDFILNGKKPTEISKLDKAVLNEYLKHLQNRAKPKTIKRKVATLRAFFNHLEFEDRIMVSPFRKMRINIEQEDPLPTVLSEEELRALFGHLYQQKAENKTGSIYARRTLIRDIALLELMFATGMRVSELCELRQDDIDFDKNLIRIRGKIGRARTIPMTSEEVINAMRHYQQVFASELKHTDFFFLNRRTEPLSEQSIRHLVAKHASAAGIDKKVTPHVFRHTVASMLVESGVDIRYIQHFLGHSSINSTQIYAQAADEAGDEVLDEKHPRKRLNP